MLLTRDLQTQAKVVKHPDYQYEKVLPLGSLQTFPITPAGGQTTKFEITPSVINLSKSYLSFTFTPPNAGALNYNRI